MSKPVVLIAEELSPATVEALGPDFEIRHCNGADRAELLAAIVDVDAILVRSATKVDAEALAAAKNLQVVARAGVGLDNVDVKAATQSGVMVVNAPTSNIVSAAELAVGLLLAAARHISPAHAALRNGEWKRSKYTGIELYEKTVGIVGLGRIGVLVAQRLAAFGMNVIAYDPYVQAGRAAQMGVRLVDLDTLLAESDFISVHLPKTPETVGLIGTDELAKAKPSLVLVNAARGGIVDEGALYAALKEGRIAGRRRRRLRQGAVHRQPALRARERRRHAPPRRVHRRGPGEGRHRRRQVGPARAQRRARARRGQRPGRRDRRGRASRHPAHREARPDLHRPRRRGRPADRRRGPRRDHRVRREGARARRAQGRLHRRRRGVRCSYVNAPLLAAERGTAVRLVAESESPDHRNLITIRGTLADGSQVSVSGTLVGIAQQERLVAVNDFLVDLEPTDHLAFFTYADRPGMVGTVGRILGDSAVNIAGMQVSRDAKGGHALVALSVDSAIPAEALAEIERRDRRDLAARRRPGLSARCAPHDPSRHLLLVACQATMTRVRGVPPRTRVMVA